MKHEITKVSDPRDLLRCQAGTTTGQCMNHVLEGTKFCPAHGGPAILAKQERADLKRFRESKWFNMLSSEADDPGALKSLVGEIAVLKVLQSEVLERCHNSHELVMSQGILSDLVVKTEKLVTSCHKLEKDMKGLLDRETLLRFASEIVEIIVEEVQDPKAQQRVSRLITEAFNKVTQGNEDD